MKPSLRTLFLGSAAIIVPHIASATPPPTPDYGYHYQGATLLVGMNTFTGDASDNYSSTAGNYQFNNVHGDAGGFSGVVSKTIVQVDPLNPDRYNAKSSTTGGSTDGTYGNANFGAANPTTTANGYVKAAENTSFDGDTGLSVVTSHTYADFKVTSTWSGSMPLGGLLFDAASSSSVSDLTVTYTTNFGASGNASFSALPSTPVGGSGNFANYALSLIGLTMTSGDWINFRFEGIQNVRIDNMALTAVPEPSSLLALGCVIGSGAFLRMRRRA